MKRRIWGNEADCCAPIKNARAVTSSMNPDPFVKTLFPRQYLTKCRVSSIGRRVHENKLSWRREQKYNNTTNLRSQVVIRLRVDDWDVLVKPYCCTFG
jgi:hypothetical protein